MKKKLLLLPLMAVALMGCTATNSGGGSTTSKDWTSVDYEQAEKFVVYVNNDKKSYDFSSYKNLQYKYYASSVISELYVKYLISNQSYTDYYCGTNVSYAIVNY